MWKVLIRFPNGTTEEPDEEFESESEADDFGLEWLNDYAQGGEILHMSNPGDYPLVEGNDPDLGLIEYVDE